MPISTGHLYNSYEALVNTFQGGFTPPVNVFMRAANDINNEMWEEKTSDAENNQKNQDDLSPFLSTKNCIVLSTNVTYGFYEYPKDYGQFSSARVAVYQGKTVGYEDCVTCGNKPEYDEEEKYQMVQRYLDGIVEHDVKKINNSKWANCLSSVTKPPTLQKPKITQDKKGFKVAPRPVSVIIMDYYTPPIPATYAYTTVPGNPQTGSGDQIIYDEANSIPFQWGSTLINEFLWRLAVRFGVYTKDQFLTQFSEMKAKETK